MPESRWKQKKTQINFKMHVNNTVCHIHDSICKNCNLHLIPFSKWDVQCISVVFIGCYQTLQDQSGLFFLWAGLILDKYSVINTETSWSVQKLQENMPTHP